MQYRAGIFVWMLAATAGCAAATPRLMPAGAPAEIEVPLLDRLPWADLSAETFARARQEGRIVLIDGSAEWCHWCHVMDATTYRNPEVRKLLAERFLPVKVDVDARPDFAERYHDWGWPATVLMTSNAEEISKFKGYIPAPKFLEMLQAVARAPVPDGATERLKATAMQPGPWTEDQLSEVAVRARRQLDALWDPREGGWGDEQKLPLAWDNAWTLMLARRGDAEARRRALSTLQKQRQIVDPVWGGISQYSTDGDWAHPHYEKLAAMQAGAVDNYASAFESTGDARWLDTAQHVRGFVDRFLTSPEGGFYTAMDADLHARGGGRTFVPGQDYYAKDDAGRRALGVPRVDTHEYGRDNGLLIAAYVTLAQAGHDPSALAAAERAAARVAETHATALGGILA